jgi:hypothetical protein
MKNLELMQHQVDFIQDYHTPFLGLVGGFRSGKSYALCVKALAMASVNTKADGALLEPTYGMITRVLIPTMNALLYKLGIKFVLNKSDGYYDVQLGGTKRIWLLSADNYERAAGMTLSWFGFDEADTMPINRAEGAFNMMTSRLTVGEAIQGFTTSTPEGFHFLFKFFEENAGQDRRLIRACTYDNPFIDPIYFSNLRQTHTEQQLKAYLYGHFVNMSEGSIYYSFDRKTHSTNFTIDDFPDAPILVGQDFNVGKNASSIACVKDGKVYFIDEITDANNTPHTIQILKDKFPNRVIYMYPDSSGKNNSTRTAVSDIALLKEAGFRLFYPNKNPPVKERIASVNTMLKNSKGEIKMFVNPLKCKNIMKSLEQHAYVNGVPDKNSGLDHMSDSFGYLIHYNWAVVGKGNVKQIY